jgi:hypothetical protein
MAPSPDKVYPQWFDISMTDMLNMGLLVESKDQNGRAIYRQSDTSRKDGKRVLEDIYRCKLLGWFPSAIHSEIRQTSHT